MRLSNLIITMFFCALTIAVFCIGCPKPVGISIDRNDVTFQIKDHVIIKHSECGHYIDIGGDPVHRPKINIGQSCPWGTLPSHVGNHNVTHLFDNYYKCNICNWVIESDTPDPACPFESESPGIMSCGNTSSGSFEFIAASGE